MFFMKNIFYDFEAFPFLYQEFLECHFLNLNIELNLFKKLIIYLIHYTS